MKQLSLRSLRKQAHHTQEEMASITGVSLTTWKKYERDPSSMPYLLFHQTLALLETAIQIRKELPMYMGKATVVFDDPNTTNQDNDYTVPIPEGLTEEFNPSHPITPKQWADYETRGIEPYEGFEDEYTEWEKAWEEVNRAQLTADGAEPLIMDMVHPDPDFDEDDEPIDYSDPSVVIDPESGNAALKVNEAELTEEEADSPDQRL